MKRGFYRKIAWTGICKNRKLYLPYILTCAGMAGMYYILSSLSLGAFLKNMRGGGLMAEILALGCGIMGIFSLLFLFYTHSFLIRRRKKEFGLYHILGMGKGNLARVLWWESVIVAAVSLAAGLAAGIAFSKFAELGMVNILHADVDFALSVEWGAVRQSILLFTGIFMVIFFNTLRQVELASPIELFHSESAGERPPKARWLLTLLGILLLGAAYWLAVSIQDPIETLLWFFVAVILVILATYILSITGSVALCRLLQKKKKYYYKTNHFVSVSSMAFRMKRNGAGLASICILSTMVLVMLSSTMCLYIGEEDSLHIRYPRDLNFSAHVKDPGRLNEEERDAVRRLCEEAVEERGLDLTNVLDYRTAGFFGYVEKGRFSLNLSSGSVFQSGQTKYTWQIYLVPLEDYNRMTGRNETLNQGETLLYTAKGEYPDDTITLSEGRTLRIRERVPEFAAGGDDMGQMFSSMYLILPDFEAQTACLREMMEANGYDTMSYLWLYGFDVSGSEKEQMDLADALRSSLRQRREDGGDQVLALSCESVAQERQDFYSLYGGLFFLGIVLGIAFLFAAALIIYYKQVAEGYEDQSRFEIMQKVGMTKKDIRSSINSQILIVFFFPLLLAGLHLCFAFPMIYKMLILFNVMNKSLLLMVTGGCYLGFALLYVAVYRITSGAYYGIVSE
ncbi:MAG: ABC transporter permease [Lachnospiraceae bacterium]|jgi:putative ABC transport system permease protein|nr:ABC transporter permease [Lachnospiraceae bacterium]